LVAGNHTELLRRLLANPELADNKIRGGMLFEVPQDYERLEELSRDPLPMAIKDGLNAGFAAITQRPVLAMQILTNRLRWSELRSAELHAAIDVSDRKLDARGPWLRSEGPLPERPTQRIVFQEPTISQCLDPEFTVLAGVTASGAVYFHDLYSGKPIQERTLATRVIGIGVGPPPYRLAVMEETGWVRVDGSTNVFSRTPTRGKYPLE
jgi:hypothetical protein